MAIGHRRSLQDILCVTLQAYEGRDTALKVMKDLQLIGDLMRMTSPEGLVRILLDLEYPAAMYVAHGLEREMRIWQAGWAGQLLLAQTRPLGPVHNRRWAALWRVDARGTHWAEACGGIDERAGVRDLHEDLTGVLVVIHRAVPPDAKVAARSIYHLGK